MAVPDGKKTVLITGTSSGLGLKAAAALAASGEWHIVSANRNMSKTLVRNPSTGSWRSSVVEAVTAGPSALLPPAAGQRHCRERVAVYAVQVWRRHLRWNN